MRHWPHAGLMLVQSLRRWPSIKPSSCKCLMFAGKFIWFYFTDKEFLSSEGRACWVSTTWPSHMPPISSRRPASSHPWPAAPRHSPVRIRVLLPRPLVSQVRGRGPPRQWPPHPGPAVHTTPPSALPGRCTPISFGVAGFWWVRPAPGVQGRDTLARPDAS